MRGGSKRKATTTRSRSLAFAAIYFGNALEWFDLVIFGYLATLLGRLFFPPDNDVIPLLLAFATFGVTFLFRPIGAVILGGYADRHGRKAALLASALLMTVGTVLIAATPTFATIGLWAPLVLLVGRIIQGVAVGGEFSSVTSYLAEQDPARRGFFAAFQFSSQGVTALLATGFGAALTVGFDTPTLEAGAWRLPFVFGALIAPLGYLMRRYASETLEFRSSPAPLTALAQHGKTEALLSASAVTLGTVCTYTILYLPTYAQRELHLPIQSGFVSGVITALILVVVPPLSGALSDRYGRLKVITPTAILILFFAYPAFAWLAAAPSLFRLIIMQAGLCILTAAYIGVLPALMAELFPPRYRGSGLAISYAVAVTLFGGFAPFIITALIEQAGPVRAPSFYLISAALISLVGFVAIANRKKTYHRI